jgi:hypothetical protein
MLFLPMWSHLPEFAELVVAVALFSAARFLERLPPLGPPKYNEAAHTEAVRVILRRYVEMLPLPELVTLQEVAALLEAGERLDVLTTRRNLDRTGELGELPGKSRVGPDRRRPPKAIDTGPTSGNAREESKPGLMDSTRHREDGDLPD